MTFGRSGIPEVSRRWQSFWTQAHSSKGGGSGLWRSRVRHYEAAEMLLRSYGAVHGLRTLDALQLAGALDLYESQLIDSIVTADRVLCRVAPMEKLAALDPEAPST